MVAIFFQNLDNRGNFRWNCRIFRRNLHESDSSTKPIFCIDLNHAILVHNMKARPEDQQKAISLRKQGYTYKEIQKQIKVSKSLLSGWFKTIALTADEEEFLRTRMKDQQDRGRVASMLSNRNRRIAREIRVYEDAKDIFSKRKNEWLFLLGVSLYWAEGSKRTGCFQFINSDPDMVIFMFKWMQKYMDADKSKIRVRLFIHRIPGYETSHQFWAKTLGIEPETFKKTIYKPTKHAIKKNPDYRGCLRLEIGGIYELRLIKAWQKLLIQYYKEVMRPW